MPPTPPRLNRPRFHVWLTPADDLEADPDYVGEVTITNADQLTAETQGRGLGIRDPKVSPFHLTNLWIWAAMIRAGLTSDKFPVFIKRMEYRPVEAEDQADDGDEEGEGLDPTTGASGASTP